MTTSAPQKQRIDRILAKFDEVRHKGTLTCFGAEQHKFRLNAPLQEHDVLRFEADHHVKLPEDYRAFLIHAGNGGAGPYYGIYTLDRWNDSLEAVCDEIPADILSLPCPLTSGMVRDDAWESRLEQHISPFQGMISLGTQGCTYEMGLIITGHSAGRVVYFDTEGQPPYVVRERDFLSWYERWLDELLGGYEMAWFGFGIGGDELHLLGRLDHHTTGEIDRIEALQALARLPHLSEKGRKQVCTFLSDPVVGVRAAACDVVARFAVAEATASLSSVLHDAAPEVRQAAIAASMSVAAELHKQDVLALLHANEVEVAQRAFFSLKEKGLLPQQELLALVKTSPHGSLRYWAAHAVKWERQHEHLLIQMLKDENLGVRSGAIGGLRQIRSSASLDAVFGLLGHETDGTLLDHILKMLGEVAGVRNADVLLEWADKGDDFQRLAAVESLCKLGDIRVKPVAESMLEVPHAPRRRDDNGFPVMTHKKSIHELVSDYLRSSPNRSLRQLAGVRHGVLHWLSLWTRKRTGTQ